MSLRLPTLVIVGRPNVGKSTMFNRLIGYSLAVVEDTPGVTRDRIYAESQWKEWKYRIVDTGGILFGDEDPLVDQIRTQAEVAMAEADVVLFVTDSADGVHTADWDLANYLRGFHRPVYMVVNKADNQERVDASPEFYRLGIGDEIFPVSALQGKGFDKLLSHVFDGLAKFHDPNAEPVEELRLAIIGRPNVGKSSMLNAFTGQQRAIVSNIPGTTRDAIDSVVQFKGRNLRLIDTAGIRRRGKVEGSIEFFMVIRAKRALERAECALVVIDGIDGLTDGDKRVCKMSLEMGKPLVIAVNKWDQIEPPTGDLGKTTDLKREFMANIRKEIPEMNYAIIRFTSAKESTGMDGVMKAVFTAVENWKFRTPTGPLNRLLQEAQFDKPLTRKGQPFKIKFGTQPQSMPPTFVLFCNNPELFHFSYQRYIENQLRKAFPLPGTPIRIVSRKSGEDRDD